jgi:CBS domain-containing protein
MVERISSILKSKGSAIHAVSPDATVYEAMYMMAKKGISAVLVIEQGSILGIISAKDYGTRVVLRGKNGRDVLAREVMSSPVVTVDPDVKIVDAMDILTTKKIRHLPIVENGDLVGVVTLADLVRAVLADKEHTIDQLMRYVGHK